MLTRAATLSFIQDVHCGIEAVLRSRPTHARASEEWANFGVFLHPSLERLCCSLQNAMETRKGILGPSCASDSSDSEVQVCVTVHLSRLQNFRVGARGPEVDSENETFGPSFSSHPAPTSSLILVTFRTWIQPWVMDR